MNQQDDRTFIKKFSGIIIGLMVVTVGIVIVAISLQDAPDPSENPSQLTNAQARIAPVGNVRTNKESTTATAAPVVAAAAPVETAPAAEIDGEKVYNGLCMSCHTAGVAGAPMPGSEEMKTRAANGIDSMVANALNGIGIMPPKGGNSSLSEEQIKAAIEYMMEP
jgi:cytochrome c5